MELKEDQVYFGSISARELVERFGSPLYIYEESVLRDRCRKVKGLCELENFHISYSAKANSSIALMRIIREEGLAVDAMSAGEIYLEKQAGFTPNQILFLSNNVSEEDFKTIVRQGVKVCVDSISQLERYCKIRPDSEVYIRLNPGVGDGHSEKVITAGKVKFGIEFDMIDAAVGKADEYGCKITGFTIHIGSLFLSPEIFHQSVEKLLNIAEKYPDIQYIDFGGGIGIPYDRENEKDFPFEEYSKTFTETLQKWQENTGRTVTFAIQPGRYVVAEAGSCLTTVQSIKKNQGIKFIGTDLGFNMLLRPEFYGSYHEIRHAEKTSKETEPADVVGNVCESGDTLGKARSLPSNTEVGDILLIRDTGAYGYSMASNYNGMPRPAEVLIPLNGRPRLVRQRETINDLVRNQVY